MKPERHLEALVEAGMILSSELGLEPLLQRIADLSRDVVGARYAAVGVLGEEDEGGDLSRFVYSGIDDRTAAKIGDLPRGRGVLGVLIEQGRPLRLHRISDHERSYGFPPHHPPMRTFLGVPIVVRNEVFGRLYLTEKEDGEDFTEDDERIALTLATQAGIAVQNARLVQEIQDSRRDLAVLEERDRIAKELHDGVIQSIYSVGLSLQGSLSLLERDPDGARQRVDAAIGELDNVVRDVRSYIFELRPHKVAGQSIRDAIGELAKDYEVNTLGEVELDLTEDVSASLSDDQVHDLVQIVREVLSNLARHGPASRVWIAGRRDGGKVFVTIDDNGATFDVASVHRGQGLDNIEQRARRLGAGINYSPGNPRGMHRELEIVMKGDE